MIVRRKVLVDDDVDAVIGELDRPSTEHGDFGDVLGSDHSVEDGSAHQARGTSQNEMHFVDVSWSR